MSFPKQAPDYQPYHSPHTQPCGQIFLDSPHIKLRFDLIPILGYVGSLSQAWSY